MVRLPPARFRKMIRSGWLAGSRKTREDPVSPGGTGEAEVAWSVGVGLARVLFPTGKLVDVLVMTGGRPGCALRVAVDGTAIVGTQAIARTRHARRITSRL